MPPTTTATPPAPPVNTYDEMPYEGHAYAQTHPSRLSVVATLFGLDPPPVETCRVLELGCASGGNLIPMAEGLPGALAEAAGELLGGALAGSAAGVPPQADSSASSPVERTMVRREGRVITSRV